MFNVLLEHFVVSPEILCLKQRMFFVLFLQGFAFYLKKICYVIVDCKVSTEMAEVLCKIFFNLNLEKARCKPQKVASSDGEKLFVGRFLQMH